MNNLEELKEELLLQKKAVESKGGTIVMAYSKPSPAEITQGIESIKIPNLTASNATENDVIYGKTFYSGSDVLRTGTFVYETINTSNLFEYQMDVQSSTIPTIYNIPETITSIRPYMFYKNLNNVTIYFHSGITNFSEYAFANTPNFVFHNIEQMAVEKFFPYAFYKSNPEGLSFENFSDKLTVIDSYCFYNDVQDGDIINIPPAMSVINSYAFYSVETKYCKSFNIAPTTPMSLLTVDCLRNLVFDCDLTTPNKCTTVYTRFNYNGSFNNITLSEKVSALHSKCFGASDTCPVSDIRMKTMTFTRLSPPSIVNDSISQQALQNGLKIYVPDASYEAYVSAFSDYQGYVYPVSQKE